MWRNCRRDKRNKTGLHCAEEIEQLIISHKRKHNEIAPPPTVLTLHPCSTHIHKDNTHTHTPIFPKQLKQQRWSPHFRQIKLQFIFQLHPKLTLSTSSLSSLKGISQSQVCVRVERKRGEEKIKIWDVLLSKYYTWETLIQKKEKGGGETGLGFKQHLTNIVALTSSIWLSPFSNCIIPLTHPMSQIQLQAAANKRQFDWNSNLRQAGQHMDHPVWCRAKISFSHHVWQLSLHKFLEANESLLVLVCVLVPNGTRAITVAAALKGVYTTPAIRQKCKLNSSPDSYSSYNNRDCWIRKIRKS